MGTGHLIHNIKYEIGGDVEYLHQPCIQLENFPCDC